jgi:predicted LPLAT superfamily acyltransferase
MPLAEDFVSVGQAIWQLNRTGPQFSVAIRTLPTMVRILGTCVALALVVFLAFPFAHDAYRRYEVAERLKPLMSEQDQAAWRDWNGDAVSFGRSLYDRCQLTNGRDSPNCQGYKSAIE